MAHCLVGTTVSLHELKARWCFGELSSSRFKASYRKAGQDRLYDRATDGDPFEALSPNEHDDLVARIEAHQDRAGLVSVLNRHAQFVCASLTSDQLLQSFCVPGLGWRPLVQLVTEPLPFGPLHQLTIAAAIRQTQPYTQHEPIILVPWQDQHRNGRLLLEGTRRSVMFIRSDAKVIYAWVPMPAG